MFSNVWGGKRNEILIALKVPRSKNAKAPVTRGFRYSSSLDSVNWGDAANHASICNVPSPSAAPRSAATGVALHAGPVAHKRIIAAFTTGITFIALHFGLGAGVHAGRRSDRIC